MNENNDNTNSDSYLQSHIVPRSIEGISFLLP